MDLNKPADFPKIDKDNMLQHIIDFPSQCEETFNDMQNFSIPTHYIKIKNVVILGMGGSAIGGDLAKSLAVEQSKIPIYVVRDYHIPGFVNSDSLVIGSSYSGETEETLAAFEQAGKRGAKMIVVSSGGKLASVGSKYRAPFYQINYGSQPRAALGFSLMSIICILQKIGVIAFEREEIKEAILILKGYERKLRPEVPFHANSAKQIAQRVFDRIPIVYASGNLTNVGLRWKTQFNENSKTAAYSENLPELCHNSVVGYDFPKKMRDEIFTIMLQSKYDHPRTQLRANIIISILQRKRIPYESIFIQQANSPFSEMLCAITLGDYSSYYLAILNNVDPTPVEIINYLKDRLAGSKK